MRYFFTLFLISIASYTFAQSNANLKDFNAVVFKNLLNLTMKDNCKSLAFIMKVQVDSSKIISTTFSDSIDSLSATYFMKRLSNLDTKSIQNYVKEKEIISASFLMPIYYSTISEGCLKPTIESDTIIRFSKFQGSYFIGNAIWLEPVAIKVVVQRN